MSDDDYFVRNAVEYMIDDLDADERYELLTEPERTAALLWLLDGRIRIDGIGGWIETHGQRSDDAIAALHAVGAAHHAKPFEVAISLVDTRAAEGPDERMSAMDSWSPDQARAWRNAEDEYLAVARLDDLTDNYIRPFVAAHPEDFPLTIEDL